MGCKRLRPTYRVPPRSCMGPIMPAPPPPPPPAAPPAPASASPATNRVLRSQTKATKQVITPKHAAHIQSQRKKNAKRRKHLDPWYPKRKANKNPKPRAPPTTHFTCRICISHLPTSDFIRWVPPKRARFLGYGMEHLDAPLACMPHLARDPSRRHIDPICKACVGSFMAARLDTLGARRVSVGCLEPGCSTAWPWELILRYFPTSKLEDYNIASFEAWKTDAALFTCLSPTCSATGLLDPSAPGYPQIQCPECSVRSCATCLTLWHADQTCAEVSAAIVHSLMSDPEKEILALIQSKDGKRCPNCHLVIEKDGGCSSMFCSGCKKYFNWETAASAIPGTQKALPIMSETGYWPTAEMAVCEVDRMERKVATPVVGNGLRAVDLDYNEGVLHEFDFDQFLHERMGAEALGAEYAHLLTPAMLPLDEDDMDL